MGVKKIKKISSVRFFFFDLIYIFLYLLVHSRDKNDERRSTIKKNISRGVIEFLSRIKKKKTLDANGVDLYMQQ